MKIQLMHKNGFQYNIKLNSNKNITYSLPQNLQNRTQQNMTNNKHYGMPLKNNKVNIIQKDET